VFSIPSEKLEEILMLIDSDFRYPLGPIELGIGPSFGEYGNDGLQIEINGFENGSWFRWM